MLFRSGTGKGGVVLVEWGDVVSAMFGNDFLEVRLAVDDENPEEARRMTVRAVGPGWSTRWDSLTKALSEWSC